MMFYQDLSHLLVYLTCVSVHWYFYLGQTMHLSEKKTKQYGRERDTKRENADGDGGKVKEQRGMQRMAVVIVRLLHARQPMGVSSC